MTPSHTAEEMLADLACLAEIDTPYAADPHAQMAIEWCEVKARQAKLSSHSVAYKAIQEELDCIHEHMVAYRDRLNPEPAQMMAMRRGDRPKTKDLNQIALAPAGSQARSWKQQNRIPGHCGGEPVFDPATDPRATECILLYKTTAIAQIAKQLHMSQETVNRCLAYYDVKKRPRGQNVGKEGDSGSKTKEKGS